MSTFHSQGIGKLRLWQACGCYLDYFTKLNIFKQSMDLTKKLG